MTITVYILTAAEWIGTIAFAISGAATAIERGLDLFGVLFMGLITAMGGGLIRDLLLGRIPPALYTSGDYVIAALLTALFVFLWAYYVRNSFARTHTKLSFAVDMADALGLGIFCVLGTEIAMTSGYADNSFLCISMGVITGCGGGVLRDVMSREIPFVFTKHIYAVASMFGAGFYYLLTYYLECPTPTAAALSVALTVGIRCLAIINQWNLPKVRRRD